MRQRFVRAAICVYPPGWRKRYGADLEQLVLDTADGRGYSLLDDTRAVGSLVGSGLVEWLRGLGPRGQLALLSVFVGLTCLLINSVETGTDVAHQGAGVPAQFNLARSAIIGPGVDVIQSRKVPLGAGSGSPGRLAVVTLEPGSKAIVSMSGAPVRAYLDTKTGKILAVTRRFGGRGAHQLTMAQWSAGVSRHEARRGHGVGQVKPVASTTAKPLPACSGTSLSAVIGSQGAGGGLAICSPRPLQ